MVQFNALTRGPLRHVTLFEKHAAGAEGNVAIAVSRLGLSSGIITRVGDDEFGKFLLATFRSENVDTAHVEVDRDSPTAIFFIQRGYPIPGRSTVFYYRKGSAASKLSPTNVDPAYISSAKVLHITGITPALSDSAKQATMVAVQTAKEHGVVISFDTNVRLKLWKEEEARTALLPICKRSDIIFTDKMDSRVILGTDQPEEVAETLHRSGVSTVVMKLGSEGAFASSKGEKVTEPLIETYVEDPTGAGDAFAAAFLTMHLKGWKLRDCLHAASASASLVVTVRGDYENAPDLDALKSYLDYTRGEAKYLR